MDSIPQELIDKIIDNLPHPSLYSSSLVARRWRRRSQKCAFTSITFSSENDLVLWCRNIPQDSYGIPSYVRSAELSDIHSWREPALFGRVLKKLTSVTSLRITATYIPRPDELPSSVTFGEFGEKVEELFVSSPRSTTATIVSFIFSFPNLQDLLLIGKVSKKPFSSLPRMPSRRPLASLRLFIPEDGVGIALAQCGLASRVLSLGIHNTGLEQLLTLSSEVVVKLGLSDHHISTSGPLPSISLPPFPAVTSLSIILHSGEPSAHFISILSSIHSAPALAFVRFVSGVWPSGKHIPSGPWIDMDKWVVRMAMQTKVKKSLVVILASGSGRNVTGEGYLPEFKKFGGELRVETIDGNP